MLLTDPPVMVSPNLLKSAMPPPSVAAVLKVIDTPVREGTGVPVKALNKPPPKAADVLPVAGLVPPIVPPPVMVSGARLLMPPPLPAAALLEIVGLVSDTDLAPVSLETPPPAPAAAELPLIVIPVAEEVNMPPNSLSIPPPLVEVAFVEIVADVPVIVKVPLLSIPPPLAVEVVLPLPVTTSPAVFNMAFVAL